VNRNVVTKLTIYKTKHSTIGAGISKTSYINKRSYPAISAINF